MDNTICFMDHKLIKSEYSSYSSFNTIFVYICENCKTAAYFHDYKWNIAINAPPLYMVLTSNVLNLSCKEMIIKNILE